MAIAVTGRPVDGRVEGTILAIGDTGGLASPALLFGVPDDPLVAHARIGEVIAVTAGVQRADPGEDVAFLVFARDPATLLAEPPGLLGAADDIRASFSRLASRSARAGRRTAPRARDRRHERGDARSSTHR